MNYWNHVKACLLIAVLSSIAGFQTGYLSFRGLRDFWLGIIPYTFLITCDLDSAKSLVRKLWGPFKIIWYPFVDAGHREILHNPIWGPFILMSFLWIPLTLAGIDVKTESIIGAVLMLWTHIITDKVYSGAKRVVPKRVQKSIKKVF